ncbi:hypothetical protein SKAU_G00412390 [Synaphobranchus kaupii]|uniref:Uncharacterized protein n=1 Tax=Synaphobranchus kaupii TaxID=118154 RepID=A0A9Q1E7Z5_SYNKA|nr:hypothetical protein SKAU_G00412390 [Synaphobranchus kaupii]
MGLVEEVKSLRNQNAEKARKIALLENRVDDLEQYSRTNDIIVSGLDIKPRSYAHAVKRQNEEDPTEQETVSVEGQVAAFFQSHAIMLDINNLEACHPLPRCDFKKKIQSTWTSNCKIFIKLNGAPEQANVLVVRSMEELDKFK